MRNDDISTRLAVATLFIRLRSVRRTRDRLAVTQGVESVAWQSMEAQYIGTWNAMQAVQKAIAVGPAGTDPKEFVRMMAQGARVRRAVHERDLAGAA